MATYGTRKRRRTQLCNQFLFSDDDNDIMDENNVNTTTRSGSTTSRRKSGLDDDGSPVKNGSMDLFDCFTSSPKKYTKVVDEILTSPSSSNIQKKLFDVSDNGHTEVKPSLPKKSGKVDDVWKDLFDNIDGEKPPVKLAPNTVETSIWHSAFDEIQPSKSAISIDLNSDTSDFNECTSESDLELQFEEVTDVEPGVETQPVTKKNPVYLGQTYGKVRSLRVSETVDNDEHDEVPENESDSQDINDLRTISMNSHINDEIENCLDGLNYKKHGFRLLFIELTEIIYHLQQKNQVYIDYGHKIHACLKELRLENKDSQETVLNWLISVVYYYLIVNKVTIPVDLIFITNTIEIEVLQQKVVLSTIGRDSLNDIYQNLPKNYIVHLVKALCPGSTQEFNFLGDLYRTTSDIVLQIEILKYFERHLSANECIDGSEIFSSLIKTLFDNVGRNIFLKVDYHVGKLVVLLSTNYPQYRIFNQDQPLIIFQLLNRIYQNQSDQKDLCLFLLGYLVNIVESKVWHQSSEELNLLIDKNIALLDNESDEHIIKHMMGYNSMILSYLKLSKQTIPIKSNKLIEKLEKFKIIIDNEMILVKVDQIVENLRELLTTE